MSASGLRLDKGAWVACRHDALLGALGRKHKSLNLARPGADARSALQTSLPLHVAGATLLYLPKG